MMNNLDYKPSLTEDGSPDDGRPVIGLIGERLGHSYSPALHRSLVGDRYQYRLFPMPIDRVMPFIRSGRWDGLNVTIPYKKAVIPYLSELTPTAARVGAVNTVIRMPDGRLIGDNTDVAGFEALLDTLPTDSLTSLPCLITGTGGAATVARYVIERRGGHPVFVSRNPGNGDVGYDDVHLRYPRVSLIVNATPVGMYPDNDSCPLDLSRFDRVDAVADTVYNPFETALLSDAGKLGIPHRNGLLMLAVQAAASARLFLNERDIPGLSAVKQAVSETLFRTLNINLIGMPGCGKTTVATLLGQAMDRPVYSSDDGIAQLTGKTARQILTDSADGETVFRRYESQVIRDYAKLSGIILDTGGGVVTRPENKSSLSRNGWTVYVRRDVDRLPTDNRPLSLRHSPAALYRERKPLYEAFADASVENVDGQPASVTADEIVRAFTAYTDRLSDRLMTR